MNKKSKITIFFSLQKVSFERMKPFLNLAIAWEVEKLSVFKYAIYNT